jgi:hypothetical protein
MAFADAVKVDLLVKSRRSCCICHRFKGTNVEVHHIVPSAKGGSDATDNGIPLCFDCHADVEHYNVNHPKGTKYSEAELKKHRDNWFARVAATGPVQVNPAHSEIDRRVAEEIHKTMTVTDSYTFLRDHSLWNSYDGRRVDPLFDLDHKFSYPDLQFMDADLEALRASFAANLDGCTNKISLLTSPSATMKGWYTVGSEFELLTSPRYDKIKIEVEAADQACSRAAESYLQLYNRVREKLGLDLRFVDLDPGRHIKGEEELEL